MVSQEGLSKADFVHKLHQKVKENLEKKTDHYKRLADKGRKEMVFEPGDWVWLHMRPERFPHKRSSKLAPRGDGPFRVLERINNNAYKLELPGEFNISPTFNVADLVPFHVDEEQVLGSKPSQEGGNDVDIQPALVPEVKSTPMTRSKARKLREQFNTATQALLATQEHVDVLGSLHSFSQGTGFVPLGFPALVFNEATFQDTSHHGSALAQVVSSTHLVQEDKGASTEAYQKNGPFVDLANTFMHNPFKPKPKGACIFLIEASKETPLA